MASSASIDLVQQAYIAYYGRAADQGGLDFWAPILDENGGDLSGIIDEFANSQEYADYLGDKPLEERLEAIYQNAFNREGDADGIAFWKTAIEDGTVTEAQASLAILQGATGDDVAVVNNKVAAAKNFTVTVTSSDADYNASNVTEARSVIAAVNGDASTVNASVSATNGFVVRNGGELPEPGEVNTTFVTETVLTDENGENGASSMRLTGDQSVRVDFTDPNDQITGVDLDRDGVIEQNGLENTSIAHGLVAADHVVVDAYARNPINQYDATQNFLGNIYFDGTGFAGNGEGTDGNIVLGGLGADTILGGIGNDFIAGGGVANHLSGSDNLEGGRNADFFFMELSLLDPTDAPGRIDGGETADDTHAGTEESNMDSDWLLLEASDDDEPVTVLLDDASDLTDENGFVFTDQGKGTSLDQVEHVDASGNLYGFLDSLNTKIGALAGNTHDGQSENKGIGSTAQLRVTGSDNNNIIVGGYDNDVIDGGAGNDILMGGNLHYADTNPNISGANAIANDGFDKIIGGEGDDHVVFELDGGKYYGDAEPDDADGDLSDRQAGTDNDTLWLTDQVAGAATVADLTLDGVIRIDLRAPALSGQGTGGNESVSQSQTNSTLAGDVAGFENVIATGLGAIDYLAAGTNDPELNFNNQQNHHGVGAVNLDLRGSSGATNADPGFNPLDASVDGIEANEDHNDNVYEDIHVVDNILYADKGSDILEGRGGNDYLSGGAGNDLFIFAVDGDDADDDVDVIHRQEDGGEADGIWDNSKGQFEDGSYVGDFGDIGETDVENSSLRIVVVDLDEPGNELDRITVTEIRSIIRDADGDIEFSLSSDEISAANTYVELAAAIDNAIQANDAIADDLSVTLQPDNTILITDAQGRELESQLENGALISAASNNIDIQLDMTFGVPEESQSQDRLVYKSYEDRADNEAVDDNAVKGSNLSLGDEGYAEDLVIHFDEDGTKIAESQEYKITFTNLTTEDVVTIMVNGVKYELCVGKDIDGNHIPAEDTTSATQAAIQAAFIARMADFINSFMDDDTAAGSIAATEATAISLNISQREFSDGEENVFIQFPEVNIENTSGGEAASAHVDNLSEHQVLIQDFDGRDNRLNEQNVLFWGAEGYIDENGMAQNSRSILETAPEAGTAGLNEEGILWGSDAIVINAGDDDLIGGDIDADGDLVDSMTSEGIYVSDFNQVISQTIDNNFAIHGDDLLIGGLGNDVIHGGTGDDRIIASADAPSGSDTVDGGKDLYFVRTVGESKGHVEVLNTYEAEQRDRDSDVADITLISQLEEFDTGLEFGQFKDTLLAQQADFSDNTRFTITLNDYDISGEGVVLTNGGAGTLDIDEGGDGTIDHTTFFTNFENIRTVSGTGLATADDNQGRDTLNVQGLSTDTDGITFNLTNNAVAFTDRDGDGVNDSAVAPGGVWANTGAGFDRDATDEEDRFVGIEVEDSAEDPEETIYQGSNFFELPEDADEVLSVAGVENVIAGIGNDTLYIDESEAAKDNVFTASEGQDAIIYTNFFDQVDASEAYKSEPVVTIEVGDDSNVDLVKMTAGRVGETVATDQLNSVEYITIRGNTAQGAIEEDTIDVSAFAEGAQIFYGRVNRLDDEYYLTEGDIVDASGNVELVIDGITEFENVIGSGAGDTVHIADVMSNAREDFGNKDAQTISYDSFLNYDIYDFSDEDAGPRRLSLAELRGTDNGDDDTASENDIPRSLNIAQYTFDLGAGTDTVSYLQETGTVAITLDFNSETGESTGDLNIMVNDDGADAMLPVNEDADDNEGVESEYETTASDSMQDAGDRIDVLKGVERVVASQGDSVIDLTNGENFLGETETFLIQYGSNADGVADESTGTISRSVLLSKVSTGEASEPFSGLTLVEIVDDNLTDFLGDDEADTFVDGTWNRIEGSDRNERVEFTDDQALEAHTVNLRGGKNEVNYNEKTKGIAVEIVGLNGVSIDRDNDGEEDYSVSEGEVVVTAQGLNTEGGVSILDADGEETGEFYSSDTIRSNTALNPVQGADGSLRIEASQSDNDSVSLSSGLLDNLSNDITLGKQEGNSDVLEVVLGAGSDEEVTIELTGFEALRDSEGDDRYIVENLRNFISTLDLVDNLVPSQDRDTIVLTDGAFQSLPGMTINADLGVGVDPAGEGDDLNDLGIEFNVLDITQVTSSALGDNEDSFTATAAGDDKEIIVGDLELISEIKGFDTISLTDTSGAGIYVLNQVSGEIQTASGSELVEFDGANIDASRVTEQLTISVVGDAAAELTGGAADDAISGSGGNDILTGNGGADTLNGGIGQEIRQFELDGISDNTNDVVFDFMGAGVLTLSEGTDFGTGAGSDEIGLAIEDLLDSDLDTVNAVFQANGGSVEIIDVDFSTETDLLTFKFKAGSNETQAITLGMPTADGNNGTFIVSSEDTVSQGGTGGADTFVYLKSSDSKSGAMDQINGFGQEDIIDLTKVVENIPGTNTLDDDKFDHLTDQEKADVQDVVSASGTDRGTWGSFNDKIDFSKITAKGFFNSANNNAGSEILWASDGNTSSAETRVYVDVNNNGDLDSDDMVIQLNDFTTLVNAAPVITSFTTVAGIEEETPIAAGTAIATVVASDANGDPLTYSLEGETSGLFDINSNGVIVLKEETTFDFEAQSSFDLTVQVSDGEETVTSSATFTVVNVDGDNQAPVLDALTALTISEGAVTGGTVIADANATDAEGDAITYSITSGNDDGIFAIDAATGEISYAADATIEFDTNPSFALGVTASDATGSDTETLNITVTEVTGPVDTSIDDLGTDVTADAVDAGTGSFNFTDAFSVRNNVEISNFGEDDMITVSGTTADNVNIATDGTDTTITMNDNGVVSSVTLVGVTGFVFDVDSFNALSVGDIVIA